MRPMVFALLLALPITSIDAQPARNQGGGPPGLQRQQMEQRLQARLDSIVRDRGIAATDEQFARLRDVATRIERERRQLRVEEGRTRVELRKELMGTTLNEDRIAQLLGNMSRLDRRRVDLMEREQAELARFLSPSQRARYLALQEELRHNMQEMQRRRLGLDKPMPDGRHAGPPGGGRPPR